MKATIKILGKEYESKGDSVEECLMNLPYKGFSKIMSTITIGDKTVVLNLTQTNKLFSPNRLTKEIAIKQTAMKFPQYVSKNNT